MSMDYKRAEEVCGLIRADAESDALNLDGQPLSGLVVGTMFGNVLASINALAGILEQLIREAEKDAKVRSEEASI